MSGTQKAHISLSEASRLTGYSAEYLRQLCVKGKVQGQKVGKTWIISQEEVQKLDPTVVFEATVAPIPAPVPAEQVIFAEISQKLGDLGSKYENISLKLDKSPILPKKPFFPVPLRQVILIIGLFGVLSIPVGSNLFNLRDQISQLKTQYASITIQNPPAQVLEPDESYIRKLVQLTVKDILGDPAQPTLAEAPAPADEPSAQQPGVVLGLNEDLNLVATITQILSDPGIQESFRGPQGPEGLAGPALQHIPNSGSVFGTTTPTAPQGSQGTIGSATYLSAKDFFAETLTVTGASSLADTNITGTLTLNGTGSFGGNLLPTTDDTYNLGSTASRWQSLRIGTGTSSFAGPVGLGTTATLGNLDLRQLANGDTVIYAQRATDTGPTGNFLDFKTAAGSSLFSVDTAGNLVVGGTSTLNGLTITNSLLTSNAQATFTKVPTLAHVFDPSWPSGTSNGADGTIYINPASSVADGNLLSAAVGNTIKFLVDAEGDIYGGSLILTGSTTTGATTIAGNLTIQDNTTLGDATTDTMTFIAVANSNLTFKKADPSIVLDVTTATDTDYWLGAIDDADGVDDDLFQIGDGTTPGTNPFLTINTSGNVGIGTTGPTAALHLKAGTTAASTAPLKFTSGTLLTAAEAGAV